MSIHPTWTPCCPLMGSKTSQLGVDCGAHRRVQGVGPQGEPPRGPVPPGGAEHLGQEASVPRDRRQRHPASGVRLGPPTSSPQSMRYLNASNSDPPPFVWTTIADALLEKVRRGWVAPQAIAS